MSTPDPTVTRDTTILVADDISDLRQLIGMTLEPLGHRVLYAEHGHQALAMARTVRPAVVLLDVMMPGLDGYAVCAAIKAEPELRHSFVIMLTARGQQVDIQRGLSAGADRYMVKPFSPVELLEAVEAALETGAARPEEG